MSSRGALFDDSRRYRYRLWRVWDAARPIAAFVMLNPSTADARRDDPTIRRCIGFARRWGFGALDVVNLFAFRATRVDALRRGADPVGPANDRVLRCCVRRADLVVAAWGNHGLLHDSATRVGPILSAAAAVHCLGVTKQGQPRHPLYVRGDAPLVRFTSRATRSA
ncbi:MAG: DUF1643 domain-containing protein [Phycisphaerae bacterium]